MQAWVSARAVSVLEQGGIIAYPTEAVYGLGCDPGNAQAVAQLLQIKKRSISKGLILVASSWSQVEALCQSLTEDQKNKLLTPQPDKPITWLIPDDKDRVPYWVKGNHRKFALRISSHPVVRDLCDAFGGPIISTSANYSGAQALKNKIKLLKILSKQIDYIVPGSLGSSAAPSEIRDIESNQIIRPG